LNLQFVNKFKATRSIEDTGAVVTVGSDL